MADLMIDGVRIATIPDEVSNAIQRWGDCEIVRVSTRHKGKEDISGGFVGKNAGKLDPVHSVTVKFELIFEA